MTRQQAAADTGTRNERVLSIIRAAYDIIGRRGFMNVALSDIAAEAGVSKALLHYYFRNKEELVGEVYRYAMSEYLAIAVAIFAEEAPLEERIDRLFNAFYDYLRRRPEWFAVVMELTLQGMKHPERMEEIRSQHIHIRKLTADTLRRAQAGEKLPPGVDADVLASIMISMANGFAMSHIIAPEATDFARFITYFRTMIVDFMKSGGPPPRRRGQRGGKR